MRPRPAYIRPERGPLQAAAQEPACPDRRRFTSRFTTGRGTRRKIDLKKLALSRKLICNCRRSLRVKPDRNRFCGQTHTCRFSQNLGLSLFSAHRLGECVLTCVAEVAKRLFHARHTAEAALASAAFRYIRLTRVAYGGNLRQPGLARFGKFREVFF